MRQLVYWHSMIKRVTGPCIKKREGWGESVGICCYRILVLSNVFAVLAGTHLRLMSVAPSSLCDSACPISFRSMQGETNVPVMA